MSLEHVDWANIPQPEDDGAALHLEGSSVPNCSLPSTNGGTVDLGALQGRVIVYIYPMTGRPDTPLPDGWDAIPGARGCTPQSCAFRDHMHDLSKLGVHHLFGVSTQDTNYQQEAVKRLHLPFALLSDQKLAFKNSLKLPAMEVAGTTLLKRLTMVIDDSRITRVFYPVFPPDKNAEHVMGWLGTGQ